MSDMGDYLQRQGIGPEGMARYPGEVSTDGAEQGMNSNLGSIPWPSNVEKYKEPNWRDAFPLTAEGDAQIAQAEMIEELVAGFDPASGEVVIGRRLSEGEVETGRADRQEQLGRRFTRMLEEHGSSAQKEFNQFMKPNGNGTVVFDIDGVLSDSRWRLPLIRSREPIVAIENRGQELDPSGRDFPVAYHFDQVNEGERDRRWRTFYALMQFDQSFPLGEALVTMFRRIGLDIAFWTGRPELHRFDTITWLAQHDLLPLVARDDWAYRGDKEKVLEQSYSWLYMQEDRDRANASFLKEQFASRWKAIRSVDPVLVLDDDASVVRRLNELGIAAVVPVWHGEEIRGSRG